MFDSYHLICAIVFQFMREIIDPVDCLLFLRCGLGVLGSLILFVKGGSMKRDCFGCLIRYMTIPFSGFPTNRHFSLSSYLISSDFSGCRIFLNSMR